MVRFEVLLFQIFKPLLLAFLEQHGKDLDTDEIVNYRDVVNWMRDDQEASQNPGVIRLFEEQGVQSPQADNFESKVDTRYMAQAFRALMALRRGFPDDKRVFDYAQALPLEYVRSSSLTTSFYLTLVKVKSNPGVGGFYTAIATPFERLCFLMALRVVEDYRQERLPSYIWSGAEPRAKKRRTSVATQALPSFKWTRDNSQRIGYAVQTIVRAWDHFAEAFQFRNVEDLIAPYIRYVPRSMVFVAITDPLHGFARVAQGSRLVGNLSPTTDRDLCSSIAAERPTSVDKAFRTIAASFLDDLWSCVCTDGLYSMKAGNDIQSLKDFRVDGDEDIRNAPRFKALDESAVEALAAQGTRSPSLPEPGYLPFSRATLQRSRSGGKQGTSAVQTVSLLESDEDEITPVHLPSKSPQPRDGQETAPRPPRRREEEPVPDAPCAGGEDCPCFQARARLEERMGEFVRMYDCSFAELIDTDDMCATGASAVNEVHLVLTDPPFNHRRETGRSNSDHDTLSSADLQKATEVVGELLIPGGTAIIFTSPLQFQDWHTALRAVPGEGQFKVDPHPIAMVNRPGHYFGNVRKMSMALFPVTQWAVHAHRTGIRPEDAYKLVDYSNHHYVASKHPGWTNIFDGVERLKIEEILRGKNGNGNRVQFRPEQKSRELLKEIISRFSGPGALVADMFAGTFSTAAACLSLPKHRKFVGCEVRVDVFRAAKVKLVEVFAEAILDKESDIIFRSEEVLADARLVVAHSGGASGSDKDWNVPPGFPAMQSIPPTLLRSLGALLRKPRLAEEYDGVPVSRWPRKLKGSLLSVSPQALETMEAAATGICIAKSSIRHARSGDGVFAMRNFRKGEVVGFYFGALVYKDIGSRTQTTKSYGELGDLGVTVRDFNKYKLQIPVATNGLVVGQETVSELYVVPRQLCPLRKLNDPRYLPGDKDMTRVELGEMPRREANVKVTAPRVRSVREASRYSLVEVKCVKDISLGEELFFDYGSYYFQ